MHAQVVVRPELVPVEVLGADVVGRGVGAPGGSDGAHGPGSPAHQDRGAAPVVLLLLVAATRGRTARTLLEGAGLPAVDDVGPVLPGRGVGFAIVLDARGGHAHVVHEPAAAVAEGIARGPDPRCVLGPVLLRVVCDARVRRGVEPGPMGGVAVVVVRGLRVEEGVAVGVGQVAHVAVAGVEGGLGGVLVVARQHHVDVGHVAGHERVAHFDAVGAGDPSRQVGAARGGGTGVGGHERQLVVAVEARHRVRGGRRPCGDGVARIGRVLCRPPEALLVPYVGGVLVGTAVEGEAGRVVGEVAGGQFVDLERDLGELLGLVVPAVAEELVHVDAVTEGVASGHFGLLVCVVGALRVVADRRGSPLVGRFALSAAERGDLGRDFGRCGPRREGRAGEDDGLGVARRGHGRVGQPRRRRQGGHGRGAQAEHGQDGDESASHAVVLSGVLLTGNFRHGRGRLLPRT